MDAKLLIGIGLIALYFILKALKNNKEDSKEKKDPYKSIYGDEDVNVDELIDDDEDEDDDEDDEEEEEDEEELPAETEDGNPFLPYDLVPCTGIKKLVFGWKKDYQDIVKNNKMFDYQDNNEKIEIYMVENDDQEGITYYLLSDYEMFVSKNGIDIGRFEEITSVEFQNFNTRYMEDMFGMFENCFKLEKLDLSGFDTSNVENMTCAFSECRSLREINLKGINTSKVQFFSELFSGCESLESIDLSGFDTSNAEMLAEMFLECKSLRTLDLSSFDTKNSFNMINMFNECVNLETIYVSDSFVAKTLEDKDMEDPMFVNCHKLCATDADGNKFRYSDDKANYHFARIFDKTKGIEGYFTRK